MSRKPNSPHRWTVLLACSVVCWLPFWMGCTGSTLDGPTAAGAKILVDTEPGEAMGVLELKSSIITGIAPVEGPIAIVGKIIAGQDWEPDLAAFLIRDLEAENAHSHEHGGEDHSDCAFCQAKEKETGSLALVRIVNDGGESFNLDARKLLAVEENQVIVAEGIATRENDGTLVFDATKVFVRK